MIHVLIHFHNFELILGKEIDLSLLRIFFNQRRQKCGLSLRPSSRLFSCSTVCVRMVDGCKWYGASAYFKKLKVNWRISLVILKWVDENSCQFFMFEVLISDFSFRYLLYAYLSCHRHWSYYGAYIRHPLNGFINVFGAWFSNEMEDTYVCNNNHVWTLDRESDLYCKGDK